MEPQNHTEDKSSFYQHNVYYHVI